MSNFCEVCGLTECEECGVLACDVCGLTECDCEHDKELAAKALADFEQYEMAACEETTRFMEEGNNW